MEELEEKVIIEEKRHSKLIMGVLIMMLLLDILFSCNLGYAYEYKNTDDLNTAYINGKFELLFKGAAVKNQVGTDEATIAISSDMKNLNINAGTLKYPGAYVEYTAEIVNQSTVSARIESIECEGLNDTNAIKVYGLDEISDEVVLKPGEKYNLNITIKWDEEYDEEVNETVDFIVKINFIQEI